MVTSGTRGRGEPLQDVEECAVAHERPCFVRLGPPKQRAGGHRAVDQRLEGELFGPRKAVAHRGILGEQTQQRVAEKRQRRSALAHRRIRGAELMGDLQ